jgi:hypothetical protein
MTIAAGDYVLRLSTPDGPLAMRVIPAQASGDYCICGRTADGSRTPIKLVPMASLGDLGIVARSSEGQRTPLKVADGSEGLTQRFIICGDFVDTDTGEIIKRVAYVEEDVAYPIGGGFDSIATALGVQSGRLYCAANSEQVGPVDWRNRVYGFQNGTWSEVGGNSLFGFVEIGVERLVSYGGSLVAIGHFIWFGEALETSTPFPWGAAYRSGGVWVPCQATSTTGSSDGMATDAVAAEGGLAISGWHYDMWMATPVPDPQVFGVYVWNGSSMSALGGHFNQPIYGLCVYQGQLYASGMFTSYEGAPLAYLARWTGSTWESVASVGPQYRIGRWGDYLVGAGFRYDGDSATPMYSSGGLYRFLEWGDDLYACQLSGGIGRYQDDPVTPWYEFLATQISGVAIDGLVEALDF